MRGFKIPRATHSLEYNNNKFDLYKINEYEAKQLLNSFDNDCFIFTSASLLHNYGVFIKINKDVKFYSINTSNFDTLGNIVDKEVQKYPNLKLFNEGVLIDWKSTIQPERVSSSAALSEVDKSIRSLLSRAYQSAELDVPENSDGSKNSLEDFLKMFTCPICLHNRREMAFSCGHGVCKICYTKLNNKCPLCKIALLNKPYDIYNKYLVCKE